MPHARTENCGATRVGVEMFLFGVCMANRDKAGLSILLEKVAQYKRIAHLIDRSIIAQIRQVKTFLESEFVRSSDSKAKNSLY